MKTIYKVLSVAILAASLFGCSSQISQQPNSGGSVANTVTSAGDGFYVPTDTGVYEVQTVFPGSANLFYTDTNTKERIFLCADPNCSHNNENCTSYLPTPSAMFPPMLLRVGNQLLVFFTEATDSSNPYAMTMDLDGSHRQKIFELAANQTPQGGFYTNGKDLYFDIAEVSPNGDSSYQLWHADVQKGTAEKQMDLGSNENHYTLCGSVGEQLCFSQVTGEGIAHSMYSIGEKEIQKPFFVDQSTSGNSLVSNGFLFVLDENAANVTRIDLATNEKVTAPFTVKESYGTPTMRYLFDGSVLITETQNESQNGSYDTCAYVLDIDGSKCTEMTLRTPYNNRPVFVLSTVGDLCYVATDYKTYTPASTSEEGVVSEFDYVANVYAFLTKEDYVNSNSGGYQMVSDEFQ